MVATGFQTGLSSDKKLGCSVYGPILVAKMQATTNQATDTKTIMNLALKMNMFQT